MGEGNEANLDVPRPFDQPLDEHGAISESGEGLVGSRHVVLLQLLSRADNTHTTAAATHGGLAHDRVADAVGALDELTGLIQGLAGVLSSGDHRNLGLDRDFTGIGLVSEQVENLVSGANELDAVVLTSLMRCEA